MARPAARSGGSAIAATGACSLACAMPGCAIKLSVEDIVYRAARGLDRALFQKLATCGWIDAHENLILCGPTGIGKSWLASARRGTPSIAAKARVWAPIQSASACVQVAST